jgi:ferredoxin
MPRQYQLDYDVLSIIKIYKYIKSKFQEKSGLSCPIWPNGGWSNIFCGNCVEYCPTNCLSMTDEYELSTYDRHELNYNQIALGRLPMSVIDDYTIRTILNSPKKKK